MFHCCFCRFCLSCFCIYFVNFWIFLLYFLFDSSPSIYFSVIFDSFFAAFTVLLSYTCRFIPADLHTGHSRNHLGLSVGSFIGIIINRKNVHFFVLLGDNILYCHRIYNVLGRFHRDFCVS